MTSRGLIAGAAGAALALGACGSGGLGSYELYRNFTGTRRLEVVVPPGVDARGIEALARELTRRGAWEVEVERGRELDEGAARILIGDGRTPGVGALAQLNGIVFEPAGAALWFDGRRYSGPREGLALTVEDPERPGWPVTAYLATDASAAASLVTDLAPTWKPGYRCWRDGVIENEGLWDESRSLEPAASCRRLEALAREPVAASRLEDVELLAHGALDPAALARYTAKLSAARTKVRDLLGEGAPLHLRVHLWPDLESLALATGVWALAVRGPCGDVHALVAPDLADDGGAEFARAYAVALAGPPVDDWLADALGPWVAQSWYGVALDDWTDFLFAGELEPPVAQLVAPAPRASPHLVSPLRAVLLDEALARGGLEALRGAWRSGGASMWIPNDQFEGRADGDRRAAAAHQSARHAERLRVALAAGFMAGVQLVPGADRDGRGLESLATSDAAQAVADLRARGVGALALAPIAAVTYECALWPGAGGAEPFGTSTPDVGVFAAASRARRAGLDVLLAPQLLDARSATWAGATLGNTRETWTEFFGEFEDFLLHYALLAELCDARILCLGSELTPATKSMFTEADRPWIPDYFYDNDLRWKQLIAHVRRAFCGALTYAAADEGEARSLEFWSDLDFTGTNLFRPLTPKPDETVVPDDATATAVALAQLRRLTALAAELGKPALVIEAGIPATDRAALDPKLAAGSYDVYEQERLVRCFLEALKRVRAQKLPLAGVFLYSWGVDPEHGNAVDRSFTLQNRPAAELLPQFAAGK